MVCSLFQPSHTRVRVLAFSTATSSLLRDRCPHTAQREFNPDVKLPSVLQTEGLLGIRREAVSKHINPAPSCLKPVTWGPTVLEKAVKNDPALSSR